MNTSPLYTESLYTELIEFLEEKCEDAAGTDMFEYYYTKLKEAMAEYDEYMERYDRE